MLGIQTRKEPTALTVSTTMNCMDTLLELKLYQACYSLIQKLLGIKNLKMYTWSGVRVGTTTNITNMSFDLIVIHRGNLMWPDVQTKFFHPMRFPTSVGALCVVVST